MASTYEPIASTTLGSDTATVTFSSISSNYTDLVCVTSVRSSHGGVDYMGLVLNSTTTATYSMTKLYGNGSSANSLRGTTSNGSNSLFTYYLNIESSATTWTPHQIHIMSYANTNVFKTALAAGGGPGNIVDRLVSLWQSTNAIDSIQFDLYSGNFKAGSTFSVYGIKAA